MPTIIKDFHTELVETIKEVARYGKWWSSPINMGGVPGVSGGVGGPVGGIFGQLIQTKVAYDTSEEAYSGIMTNVPSGTLVDNLAHLRYRLESLEDGTLIVKENGIVVASGITIIDFIGDNVSVDLINPTEITVAFSGGAGGSGISSIDVYDNGVLQGSVTALDFMDNLEVTVVGDIAEISFSGLITDHGALTGLADDDHPQYRLENENHSHQSTGLQAGQLDHGLALTGLGDDDHTQYVLRSILTSEGDIFTLSGGAVVRLGIGSPSDVLTTIGGLPAWQAGTPGSNHTILSPTHTDAITASVVQGNIIIGNTTPAWSGLAIGGASSILGVSAGLPAWVAQSYIDHGTLGGLNDNDHAQYVLRQPIADTIINDAAGDFDFRFESTTNPNLLFLDAGNSRVGIGTATLPTGYTLTINGDTRVRNAAATRYRTDWLVGATEAVINAYDDTGLVHIPMRLSGNNIRLWPNANQDGSIIVGSGYLEQYNSTSSISNKFYSYAPNVTVLNEQGVDIDLRIEGVTDPYLLFIDAGNDRVGIGSATPAAKFDVRGTAGTIARFTSTAASSSSGGGSFQTHADDGAAMASGDRLGLFGIGGATDGSSTVYNAITIEGFTTEAWSSTAGGAEIRFFTTPNTTVARTEAMRIQQDQLLRLASASWTANGSVSTVLTGSLGPAGIGTSTVSKWLTLVDNAGVTMYIPAWT